MKTRFVDLPLRFEVKLFEFRVGLFLRWLKGELF